jgi:hypothetical protein
MLGGSEWLASRFGRFIHANKAPSTYWVTGCVGSKVGLDTGMAETEIPATAPEVELVVSHFMTEVSIATDYSS